jgi:hypothetical protein
LDPIVNVAVEHERARPEQAGAVTERLTVDVLLHVRRDALGLRVNRVEERAVVVAGRGRDEGMLNLDAVLVVTDRDDRVRVPLLTSDRQSSAGCP